MPIVKEKLKNVKLMVVGSFADDKSVYMQLINDMHIEDYVDIKDGYTLDGEVEKYFAACDVVVLPYESATQSGIVQIAYGFEKPVIVTNVGGFLFCSILLLIPVTIEHVLTFGVPETEYLSDAAIFSIQTIGVFMPGYL